MSIVQQLLANPERFSVQELQHGVQDGAIPAYVGIPLIQDKMKRQQQAQAMAGAQQQQQPPIAQQIMQQAAAAHPGIAGLPSNLPEEGMAKGGIVAFSGDDPDVGSYVTDTPLGRLGSDISDWFSERSKRQRAILDQEQQARDTAAQAEALGRQIQEKGGYGLGFLNPFAKVSAGDVRQAQLLNSALSKGPVSLEQMQALQSTGSVPPAASVTPAAQAQNTTAQTPNVDLASQLREQGIGGLQPTSDVAAPPINIAPPVSRPALRPGITALTSATSADNTELGKLRKAYEDIVTQTQNVQLPTPDYSKREARISADEKKAQQTEKDNLNMALVRAGATLMMTPGNLGQSLGAATMAGLDAYVRGKKDIRDLEKDISDRRDKIEDLMDKGQTDKAHLEMQKLAQRVALHKETYATAAHLEGINRQVAGHLQAAEIGAARYGDAAERMDRMERAKYFHEGAAALGRQITDLQKDMTIAPMEKAARLRDLTAQQQDYLNKWGSLIGISGPTAGASAGNVVDFGALPKRS